MAVSISAASSPASAVSRSTITITPLDAAIVFCHVTHDHSHLHFTIDCVKIMMSSYDVHREIFALLTVDIYFYKCIYVCCIASVQLQISK